MMRILGNISIYGTKASLEPLVSAAVIKGGVISQIGLARKVPDVDSWCYASPLYRFRVDAIDQEIRDFIAINSKLNIFLAVRDPGIKYAFLTIIPVEQNGEETFGCVLSHETIGVLWHIGLALQIAPANIMPAAPFWKHSRSD